MRRFAFMVWPSYGRNDIEEEGMPNRSRCVHVTTRTGRSTTIGNVTLGVYMFPDLWMVRLPVLEPSKTESDSQHFLLQPFVLF